MPPSRTTWLTQCKYTFFMMFPVPRFRALFLYRSTLPTAYLCEHDIEKAWMSASCCMVLLMLYLLTLWLSRSRSWICTPVPSVACNRNEMRTAIFPRWKKIGLHENLATRPKGRAFYEGQVYLCTQIFPRRRVCFAAVNWPNKCDWLMSCQNIWSHFFIW